MPRNLAEARAANARAAAALTKASPGLVPLAVLLGGTSGIGLATAYALSSAFHGRVHLILASRSASKAAEVIRGLPYPPLPESDHGKAGAAAATARSTANGGGSVEFIPVDASSMASVRSLGQAVRARAEERTGGRINYLVLSCGQLVLQGSDRTPDGLERKLAMNYYARIALAEMLRPNLEKAREAGQPARVLSVLAPGRGGPIDTSDFGLAKEAQRSGHSLLKRGHWLRQAEMAGVTYTDWAIEHLAALAPTVAWAHSYPGIVRTAVMSNMPLPVRLLSAPLFLVAGLSAEESGEQHAHFLLDDTDADANVEGAPARGGAFFRGPRGEPVERTRIAGLEGEERTAKIRALWEHTMQVTGLASS